MADKKLCAAVERLVQWRSEQLQTSDVEVICDSLTPKNFPDKDLPKGIPEKALRTWRRKGDDNKRKFIRKHLAKPMQMPLPLPNTAAPDRVSETVPGTPSEEMQSETVPGTPSETLPEAVLEPRAPETALVRLSRETRLELAQDDVGAIFISIRCVAKNLGKDADNLRSTWEKRGLPFKDFGFPNVRGQIRSAPAVPVEHLFTIISMADTHGMNALQKEWLFKLQADLPTWAARLQQVQEEQRAKPNDGALVPRGLTELVTTWGTKIVGAITTFRDEVKPEIVRVVSAVNSFREHHDLRVDRVEKLLQPVVHTLASLAVVAPTLSRIEQRVEAVQRAVVEPRRTYQVEVTGTLAENRRKIDGSEKTGLNHPLKDLEWIVKHLNKNLKNLGLPEVTKEVVIEMAARAEILYHELWGQDRSARGPAIVLEDGKRFYWYFDQDAYHKLLAIAQKQRLAAHEDVTPPN